MIAGVGVLYDYFAAATDEQAAAAIDLPGGPVGSTPPDPHLRAALRAGDRAAVSRLLRPRVRRSEHGLLVLSVKGIDPTIHLDALEELLTGATFDEIVARPDSRRIVADRDGGERLVIALSPTLEQALVSRSDDQLTAVAGPWLQTEDFHGDGDPGVLAGFLHELAALARQAHAAGRRVYCWVCV
jgi:hypothetical protein